MEGVLCKQWSLSEPLSKASHSNTKTAPTEPTAHSDRLHHSSPPQTPASPWSTLWQLVSVDCWDHLASGGKATPAPNSKSTEEFKGKYCQNKYKAELCKVEEGEIGELLEPATDNRRAGGVTPVNN